MKLRAAALALVMISPAAAQAPGSAEGRWRTPARNGEVEISQCGPALCGRLVDADGIRANPGLRDTNNRDPALRNRPIKDLQILEGFTGGPTEWRGGTVYNPEDGGTYRGRIRLVDPDTLKLRGCIVAPLCKTQTWKRIR